MAFNFVPLSPESDVFSTPPTSPMPPVHHTDASLNPVLPTSASTKRGARPQQLLLDPAKSRKGGIELERTPKGGLSFLAQSIPDIDEQSAARSPIMPINEQILKSPCFVHSQLEKGASLVDWLKHTHVNGAVSLAKSLGNAGAGGSEHTGSPSSATLHEDEEDESFSRSLTRQLAETAVGVREMSKALGEWPNFGTIVTVLTIHH